MADIQSLDLESFLKPSKSNLPTPCHDTIFFPASNKWGSAAKLNKSQTKGGVAHFYCLVEPAKSSLSSCRRCGAKVNKGGLRFGYLTGDPRGELGVIAVWFHPACAPLSHVKHGAATFKDVKDGCQGYNELSEELKEELQRIEPSAEPTLTVDSMKELVQRVLTANIPPPPELLVELLPFQAEGFAWMVNQELSSVKGGILADEMGMGKTLQCIATILKRKDVVRPTLVVAPVAAVLQWFTEIQKFSGEVLKVHVYHSNSKLPAERLREFDVVLTTYQTLENEYRREANKKKLSCPYCEKLFLKSKLRMHLKYFCGPEAERTAKQKLTSRNAATEKAKRTMGIGNEYQPPTIANVFREIVRGVVNKSEVSSDSSVISSDEEDEADSESSDNCESSSDHEERTRKTGTRNLTKLKNLKTGSRPAPKIVGQTPRRDSPPAKRPRRAGTVSSYRAFLATSSEEEEAVRTTQSIKDEETKTDGSVLVDRSALVLELGKLTVSEIKARLIELGAVDSAKKRTKKELVETLADHTVSVSVQPHSVKNRSAAKGKQLDQKVVSKKNQRGKQEKALQSDSEEYYVSSDSSNDGTESLVSSDGSDEQTPSDAEDSSLDCSLEASAKHSKLTSGGVDEEIDLSKSPLHSVEWGRVVLDEAHRVKQRTNNTAVAAFRLSAVYRWCLSGTPLQNRVGELYSLLRFCRFSPFAFYFCKAKGCECKSLDYVFEDNKYCVCCGHTKMQHYSYFKQMISNPIVKFSFRGAGAEAMRILKADVLDKLLLRRTKEERSADLNLPPIDVLIRKSPLGEAEQDFYTALHAQSRTKFDTFANQGTLLHNYAHIFDLLTRLRQAADHPYLLTRRAKEVEGPKSSSSLVCGVCNDDIEDSLKMQGACGHHFHKSCVDEYLSQAPPLALGGVGCPVCYAELKITADDTTAKKSEEEDEIEDNSGTPETTCSFGAEADSGKVSSTKQGSILKGLTNANFQSSSKLEMLADEVSRMPQTDKCLVFSQFTRMLDLAEFRLRQDGIECAKLTGAQSLKQRNNIILAFHRDPSLRVLLVSLKAGGEGVNLQVANNIFLLDPWWNPASELQAIQRAHRIGHKKSVRAVRLIASNTIEEKILALQEKKQLVFDGTVGQCEGALNKLNGADLAFLFQQ